MKVKMREYFSAETTTVGVAADNIRGMTGLVTHQKAIGICSRLGDHLVGLFVIENAIYFYVDGRVHEIDCDRDHVSFSQDGINRQLDMTIDGAAFCVKYKNDRLPVSTPFYSEDEEDADFGLWLANVLGSDDRRKSFLQGWQT